MKKILTSALAIVLFVGASQAQTTAPEKGQGRGHGREMMKDLNLTDAQKTQLKSIREAEKKDAEALKAQGNATPEQRKAVHEKYRSQLDAVLTPEQREQMKNEMKAHRMDSTGRGGRGFDRKGDRFGNAAPFIKEDLNLTADQQTKLKSYADDFRIKAKDIRANSSLTDEQKKEQLRTLSKTYTEQSRGLLTPEQLQKVKEGRGKRNGKSVSNV